MAGRRWLVTALAVGMIALGACGGDGDEDEAVRELPAQIKAADNARFDPEEVSVPFNRETQFTFVNEDDERMHNFTLSYVFTDADNFVSVDVAPRERKEVRFTVRERPAAGFLTFYCRFHQAEGMAGRIRLA